MGTYCKKKFDEKQPPPPCSPPTKKSDSERWASYNTTDCTLDDFILFIRKKKKRFEWFLSMPILRYNRKEKKESIKCKKNFVSIEKTNQKNKS